MEIPRGSWDCHTHIFAPSGEGPPLDAAAYAPPAGHFTMHREMLAALGFERALLVQPSLYGTDHSVLLASLARSGGQLRGIGSCPVSTTEADLHHLRSQGVIAMRFVGVLGPGGGAYPGTQGLDVLEHLYPALSAAGMQVHLWADLETCTSLASSAATGNLPIVLDHLGGLSPEDTPGTPRFDRFADALSSGMAWVKLTYLRRSRQPGEYEDIRPVVEALAERVPEQIIWGSDWPFVRLDPPPNGARLVRLLSEWLGPEIFALCLRDNPDRLIAWGEHLDAAEAGP
ncbi:amidohydrolase family protein [Altererythrobacter sp. B11]|uniref:amidohydrolase family protein n=1 Tax=Altererythrobacter sp. B11 TaxID=2060312 RepID=UPI0015592896|nr:amidohydrolase family protein [Altererythrobacter sp. B11]